MDPFPLPPTLDCATEECFCGRKTVKPHEFYCSTECARSDALRSLDNPECHYRKVVQAYVQAGVPELQPRRTVSVGQLRPSHPEQHGFAHVPPLSALPTHLRQQNNATPTRTAEGRNVPGLPTLSQVMGKVLTKKANAGEPLVVEKHDRPRWQGFPNSTSRARPVQPHPDHAIPDANLSSGATPARTLRRVPTTINSLRHKPSAAGFLHFEKPGQNREGGNSEKVFGHAAGPVVPPERKDSLPLNRQMNPPSSKEAKALRRSASFAGWNASVRLGPSGTQDPLMHIIEEMREELSEGFDPRALFDEGD